MPLQDQFAPARSDSIYRDGMMAIMNLNRTKTFLLVFGISSCFILLNTTQRTIIALTDEYFSKHRFTGFITDALHWYLWGAAVFPIYLLARRISLKDRNKLVILGLHLFLGFIFALAHIALQSSFLALVQTESLLTLIQRGFYARLFMRTAVYFLIVIACYVYISHQRRREEELKARDLETRLAIAQLQVLKSKMNPEFLFHTLQSISILMRRDIEAADLLTARLGDFLRLSLENSCAGSVPLQEEIDLVRSYIEIQRILRPEILLDVQVDPHSIGTPVPNRLLLDAIQSLGPGQRFEISSVVDKDHVKLSISGVIPWSLQHKAADSPSLHPSPFQWQEEKDRVTINVPLQVREERVQSSKETFYESLDEIRTSLARKEQQIQSSRPSFRKRFWGTLAIWTLAGIFFLISEILTRLSAGEPLQILESVKDSAAWYWWALFTPISFYLARRFPLRPGQLRKNISLHILFSIVISFTMVILYFGQRWAFGLEAGATFKQALLRYSYLFDALTYWAIVGVHEGLTYHREYLLEEVHTAKLRGNLTEAQVQALKMQLHPHFLFNTLNSISELMHEDLDATDKMLKRLEDFLRLTFQNSDVQEITLQTELNFLRNYLDIQQVRFQNRLKVDMEIDPQAMRDRVPNLILQPIVENAIRHGVAPRIDSGRVEIRAFHRDGKLLLEVEDDGPGLSGGSFREGVGMSNTRMRLEQIYGKECSFHVQNNPHGGLLVTLQIPAIREAGMLL